ncbi:uncharacterized protein LOC132266999 [Cornus florida]|uniref:uncharacterized protein LOC132266999 n=1 Tax=Cornus florida TaxID=4283 RepID=UPI00289F90F4|nr:uncharacterized protein LOC132266999 [Cornus florida]
MGGADGRSTSCSSSSSGEEDGDAEWRAAINCVATTTNSLSSTSNGSTPKSSGRPSEDNKPPNIKHYHIKAQKLLDGILEKTIEVVRDPADIPHSDPMISECGVRLFKHAPPGIVFDHVDELQRPTKRPRIPPIEEIDEKSKKFRRQLQSVAVDGTDIIAAARDACQKSLARIEAKDAAAKAAAKREEERVAELKRIRGERWLPSIARDMQERRFNAVFEAVSWAARTLTMALVLCFLNIHHIPRSGELSVVLI